MIKVAAETLINARIFLVIVSSSPGDPDRL
jgi:hypothetical protein